MQTANQNAEWYTYQFRSVNGTDLGTLRATAPDWAGLMFLKLTKGGVPADDVIISYVGPHGERVVAIISDRGKTKPDIMVIEQMRRRTAASVA